MKTYLYFNSVYCQDYTVFRQPVVHSEISKFQKGDNDLWQTIVALTVEWK